MREGVRSRGIGWLVVWTSLLTSPLISPVFAAGPTGSIVGKVLDPSGAAVANAKVVVTAPATGFSREVTSSEDGGYVCSLLPVGSYTVSVEAPGFKQFEQAEVEVRVEIPSTVYARLTVGDIKEVVTVEGHGELVDTRTGTLRDTIEQRAMLDLPLNGRNAADLVLLSAGTADLRFTGSGAGAGDAGDLQQPVTFAGAVYISSNGAQAQGVNYTLDGGNNVDPYSNINNPFPNPDALEEFTVQTSNYGAEFGRGVGAVVNVVTKSGTNQLHGDLFEFLRNGAFNAAPFFSTSGPDQLKRNQFGGSIGGPILKNKLFFFGNYQGTIEHNVSTGNKVPSFTAAELTGDFSALLAGPNPVQLVNPFTQSPYLNNQIPQTDFSSVTQNLLKVLPSSPDGFISYTSPSRSKDHEFLGRVDFNSGKQRIYSRYFYARHISPAQTSATDMLALSGGEDFTNYAIVGSHTYSFTPTFLNTVLFSFDRNDGKTTASAPFDISSQGVDIASPPQPELFLSVGGLWSVRSGRFRNIQRDNLNFSDSVLWARGKHEMALGGDYTRQNVTGANRNRQSGQFTFDAVSGDALADLLVGYVARFKQGGGEFQNHTGNLPSLFFNDSIRILPNLTVSLGLRWDPFVPYSDSYGRAPCYRPGSQSTRFPNSPLGYIFAGDAGCPAGGTNSSLALFSPRVGFSYDLRGDGKTVVRGGAGLFSQPPFMGSFNQLVNSAPFSPQVQFNGVPFATPYQGAEQPFPAQYAPFVPAKDVSFANLLAGMAGVSFAPNWHPMQLWNWNLTVERQLRSDTVVRAAYVGSKGTHLSYNTDANAPVYDPASGTSNVPDANFGQIPFDTSGGNSIYHSVQLSVEKRMSHGFAVSANYSWNHIDDWNSYSSDLDTINTINPFRPGAFRGTSDYDIRHRLTSHFVWDLPSPSQGLARYLLGNWKSSGIWTWQSGQPITIFSGNDNYSGNGSGVGLDLARIVSQPNYTSGSIDSRVANGWFTASSFDQNLPGTFGDPASRNRLRGPRQFNVDFSLQKDIPFTEHWKLQFRAEAFNVLNHPQFGIPDNIQADGSNFGKILGVSDPRIMQLALKLYF